MDWKRIAAMTALGLVMGLAVPVGAHAQGTEHGNSGSGGGNSSNQTNSYTLTQDTYDQVQRVQKQIAAQHYDQALKTAKNVLPRARRESPYAHALVLQLMANIYLMQKEYEQAAPVLAQIVQLDALQPSSEQDVIYQLANIYLIEKKYPDAVRLYKEVLAKTEQKKQTPDPSLYYQLGLAYSLENDFNQADKYISEAIQKSTTKHKDWYQNWFIAAYKLKNYQKANRIAKTLIVNWPDDADFWNYYANTFLLLKDDKNATAVYALMYDRGMLKDKDSLLQLANLYFEENAPYKAGKLLSENMAKGIIPKTKDNYDILASAWMQSREWGKALDALGEEAKLAATGSVYLRQAAIYLNQEDYAHAEQAAQNAISKGGLKNDAGRAWMIAGQAAYAQKKWDAALHAFHQAENFKDQRDNAKSWVQYVDSSRNASGNGGR